MAGNRVALGAGRDARVVEGHLAPRTGYMAGCAGGGIMPGGSVMAVGAVGEVVEHRTVAPGECAVAGPTVTSQIAVRRVMAGSTVGGASIVLEIHFRPV